ncbi:hypothetical protein ROG8370_01899 [Roseovarius gaetbuli]|uniref:UDP-N-acetylmuramate--alanine ligase n=1 Tax=Roseovarius gaetbuli TaxID=1356575 RepID=A0A1X6Z910_9RHOB|nr:DUF2484 family protein [Roseovarius gaetbuli]SLN44376.1 hypothetical protein ROG8370_01899 [Roseovarius gaetbuli]
MSPSLLIASLWVLAASIVALLPMRRQYIPGVTLLILAPAVIGFIGYQHGWLVALGGVLALGSMFRRPLRYGIARLRGQNPEVPK